MEKNKKKVVIITCITIFSVIIPAIFWFSSRQQQTPLSSNNKAKVAANSKSSIEQYNRPEIAGRISVGDKILITAIQNQNKQAAAKALSVNNYTEAASQYNSSLNVEPNDPEAVIYRNNSLAKLKGETLKLATSVPIGGNLHVAQEILRGIAQAQTKVNRDGGINGKLVEIKIANDDNEPEIAKQVASELVKDEQILAVIGHNDSNASIAAAPIYQQANLVMITPTSSAENLPAMGNYIFRATPNTRALADRLANYAVDFANQKNIAVCADSQAEVSKSFQEEFIWAIYSRGGSITPTKCDLAAADFNPSQIPSQMINDGAETLLLAPSVRSVDRAIAVARANQERLTLLGNHSLNTYETLQQGQKSVNGMVLAAAWHSKDKTQNAFVLDAQKLWGGAVNWRTAMAYDATIAAVNGLKFGNTRPQVQMALSNPQFKVEGATESIRFLPLGDRNMKGALIKIEPGKRSGTGYDFVLFEPYKDK